MHNGNNIYRPLTTCVGLVLNRIVGMYCLRDIDMLIKILNNRETDGQKEFLNIDDNVTSCSLTIKLASELTDRSRRFILQASGWISCKRLGSDNGETRSISVKRASRGSINTCDSVDKDQLQKNAPGPSQYHVMDPLQKPSLSKKTVFPVW